MCSGLNEALFPCSSAQDCEEPLMFCLNGEDEEGSPAQSDSGRKFKFSLIFFGLFLPYIFWGFREIESNLAYEHQH